MILAYHQEHKILHNMYSQVLLQVKDDEAIFLLLSPISPNLSSTITLYHQELFSVNGNLETFVRISIYFIMFSLLF